MKRRYARNIRQSRKNDFLGIVIAPKPKRTLTPEQKEKMKAAKAAKKATKKATSFDKLKHDADKMLNNLPTKVFVYASGGLMSI